jgi:hypothetical protein
MIMRSVDLFETECLFYLYLKRSFETSFAPTYRSAHETSICRNPPTQFYRKQTTGPILSRTTLQHVMFLQKCKNKQFFVHTTFWHKVCLQPGCTVKRELTNCVGYDMLLFRERNTGWSKSLCAPDDYSTKNTKNILNSLVTYHESVVRIRDNRWC